MKLRYSKFIELLFVVLSPVVFVLLILNLVNLRSTCTAERRKMAKVISDIASLKEQYNNLQIKFYSSIKPSNVDNSTKNLKFLKENEVYYIE